MKMKVSEVLDRWTILLQKARFDENAKLELETQFDAEVSGIVCDIVRRELSIASNEEIRPIDLVDVLWSAEYLAFLKAVLKLQEANAKIWILEASIRKEFANDPAAKKDLSLEEIGERALAIREHNSLRIQAKKQIDEIFGEIPDVKVNHASSA